MEYNGNTFRHYICNYWYEVGTKFDDCGTKFVELSTKYNPEVSKYTPRRRFAQPGGVFGHKGSKFDHLGIVFLRKFDKMRTAIVKLCTNFIPIFEKRLTNIRLVDVIKQHFGVWALEIEYYGQSFVWVRFSKMYSSRRAGKRSPQVVKSQNVWISSVILWFYQFPHSIRCKKHPRCI